MSGNGAYRCPPDTDGNAEEKEADCASSSPVCYSAYSGICGCSKDTSNHAVGDGTTQGSCSTDQRCHSDGSCKGKSIHCQMALWLLFLFQKEKTTALLPAESRYFLSSIIFYRVMSIMPLLLRKLNKECNWLNFFDSHDIWHFLSGAGLFFEFMFILTIDDDVRFRRTDMLNIF